MRWEDEHWIKLYTRDTPTWKIMCWQGRVLLPLLLRKVDKAGLLECGDLGRSAIGLMVDLPEEVVLPGLKDLERLKVIIWHGGVLEVPKFEEAQEAQTSDVVRKREQRARAKAKARADVVISQPAVIPEGVSRDVTQGHAKSRPDSPDQTRPDRPDAPETKAVARTAPEPSLRDHLETDFKAIKGAPYAWVNTNLADDKAVGLLLGFGAWPEIRRRWAIALRMKYPACGGVADLARHWNAYATDVLAAGPAPPPLRVPAKQLSIEEAYPIMPRRGGE